MKTPLQIGITGGIGSGKSLVSRIFRTLGAPVYDADTAAKKLMLTDAALIEGIKRALGPESYFSDGSLNRAFISSLAFGSPAKIKTLNELVHPRVGAVYRTWVAGQSAPFTIKEAALLFESGSYKELDVIITVTAPESVRIARVLKRDPQRTEADVRRIIANQLTEDEKIKRADFVIENDGTQLIVPRIVELDEILRARSAVSR